MRINALVGIVDVRNFNHIKTQSQHHCSYGNKHVSGLSFVVKKTPTVTTQVDTVNRMERCVKCHAAAGKEGCNSLWPGHCFPGSCVPAP